VYWLFAARQAEAVAFLDNLFFCFLVIKSASRLPAVSWALSSLLSDISVVPELDDQDFSWQENSSSSWRLNCLLKFFSNTV